MRILVLGATGMVGQGALRECLLETRIDTVLTLVRAPTGQTHPKLTELVCPDLTQLATLSTQLAGLDACLNCIGVSAFRMTEAEYTRQTYDLTLSIATLLAALNPGMAMVYVTGLGTNPNGKAMWAQVKGRTELALQALPFRAVYLFRPGLIQPLDGITSRTGWYRRIYAVTQPLFGLGLRLFPNQVTSTALLGRAMIAAVLSGNPRPIVETTDINRLSHLR